MMIEYKIPMKDGNIYYGQVAQDISLAEKARPALHGSPETANILRALRNHALEEAARVVDRANINGPYNAVASASVIRSLKEPTP